MRKIITIYKKELKDSLRDRRTLFMMIVLPMILIPGIILLMTKVQMAQAKKAMEKEIKVAFIGGNFTPELIQMFVEKGRIQFIKDCPVDSVEILVKRGELDGGVVITSGFNQLVSNDEQGTVRVIFKKSDDAFGVLEKRLISTIEQYDQQIVDKRISRLGLDKNLFNPIDIVKTDVSTTREKLAETAGGFLPYLFILFTFMGAMYPGLDLGAGEKERGTMETILSSPASRLDIVLGKFGVIMTAGIATALISFASLNVAVQLFPEIPVDILDIISNMLGVKMVALILTLIIPIAVFFSAAILSLSIYARSFKEAQSIVTPLNIAIIVPAAIGLTPGMELNKITALIPILNVSLATKEMLSGSINWILLSEVYASLIVLAGFSLWFCVKWFNREETIFRN